MFDKKSFRDMKKELEKCEHEIEKAIMHSRELTRESKLAIYSVHRGDINEAEKKLINVRRELKKIKTKNYLYSVSYQEYVEAECILAFAKNKKIPTHTLLGIDAENYLLGICDFTGELARMAVNKAIRKDKKTVEKIRQLIDDVMGEFLKFNLKNGELRKKYDSIKWNLNKVEQVLYDLKGK